MMNWWGMNEWNYGEQRDEASLVGIHVASTETVSLRSLAGVDRQVYFILANGTCVNNSSDDVIHQQLASSEIELTLSGRSLLRRDLRTGTYRTRGHAVKNFPKKGFLLV